jgi:hypothetical protein
MAAAPDELYVRPFKRDVADKVDQAIQELADFPL